MSAFYLRPAAPGAVHVWTAVVREGRRLSTAEARLVQNDREIARVVGSFTDLDFAAPGTRAVELAEPPRLPPPEACVPVTSEVPGITCAERVEFRIAERPGWLDGRTSGRPHMEFWMRLERERPTDPIALLFLVDAAPPAVLELVAQARQLAVLG